MGVEQAIPSPEESKYISSRFELSSNAISQIIVTMETELGMSLAMPEYSSDRGWRQMPVKNGHLTSEQRVQQGLEESIVCLDDLFGSMRAGNNVVLYPERTRFLEEGRSIEGKSRFMYLREQAAARAELASLFLYKYFPDHKLRLRDGARTPLSQKLEYEEKRQEKIQEFLAGGISLNIPETQKKLIDAVERYIAPLEHAAHVAGGALDADLLGPDGQPLLMGWNEEENRPLRFGDEFAMQADYYVGVLKNPLLSLEKRKQYEQYHMNRMILYSVMRAAGFTGNPNEWWHFDFGTKQWAYRTGAPEALYGPAPRELFARARHHDLEDKIQERLMQMLGDISLN